MLYSDLFVSFSEINEDVGRSSSQRFRFDSVQAHEMLYGPATPTTSSFDDEQVFMHAQSQHRPIGLRRH